MSKKSFVIFWPVLLLLGSLIFSVISLYPIQVRDLYLIPEMYIYYFLDGPYVLYSYTAFAFSMLIISLILWFKRPCIWTLLGTIITAWGLCGIPAMYIIAMSHFRQ